MENLTMVEDLLVKNCSVINMRWKVVELVVWVMISWDLTRLEMLSINLYTGILIGQKFVSNHLR